MGIPVVLPIAALDDDGDVFRVIDALANQVGVLGLFSFSDWPATTTFYANCAGTTPAPAAAH